MFNFSKKKTIFGLIGIAVCISAFAISIGFLPRGDLSERSLWAIFLNFVSASFLSVALGLLLYIFFDKRFFWIVFGTFEIVIVLQLVLKYTLETNVELSLFIIAGLILTGLLFIFIRDYRSNKININGIDEKKISKKEQQEIDEISKALLDDEKLKTEIGYPDRSIVVTAQRGTVYQLIKTDDSYYFHRVGNIFTGIDNGKFVSETEDVKSIQSEGKKDFEIKRADIDGIRVNLNYMPQLLDFGTIIFKSTDGKKKKFSLMNLIEKEELNRFFGSGTEMEENKNFHKYKEEEENEKELSSEDKAKLNKINLFVFIFSLISSFFLVFYTFFNSEYTNAFLSTTCVILTLASFGIYLLFPDYLTIDERKNYVNNGRISYLTHIFLIPLLMVIKCMLNLFVVVDYDWVKLIIYSAILIVVLTALFILRSKEYKKKKSLLFVAIFALLIISPTCVAKINSGLDFSAPQEIVCQISNKDTYTDKSGDTTYYLFIEYNGEEIRREVGEETFNDKDIGDSVTVLKFSGSLGIEKAVFNG